MYVCVHGKECLELPEKELDPNSMKDLGCAAS